METLVLKRVENVHNTFWFTFENFEPISINLGNYFTRRKHTPKSVRYNVLKRDNFKCLFCGRSSKTTELVLDHKIPLCKGGTYSIENLQTLCVDCNNSKNSEI